MIWCLCMLYETKHKLQNSNRNQMKPKPARAYQSSKSPERHTYIFCFLCVHTFLYKLYNVYPSPRINHPPSGPPTTTIWTQIYKYTVRIQNSHKYWNWTNGWSEPREWGATIRTDFTQNKWNTNNTKNAAFFTYYLQTNKQTTATEQNATNIERKNYLTIYLYIYIYTTILYEGGWYIVYDINQITAPYFKTADRNTVQQLLQNKKEKRRTTTKTL